jgi:phosphoglycolate phosphatase-like HAD superfamily hydrolase
MGNLFVWDFHGVLEKDNEYAVQEVVNRVLLEFNINKKSTVEECRAMYGRKWADYFKFYAPNANEDTIHKMVVKATEISIGERIATKYIKPTEHAHDVLKQIADKGHTNLIMSNSSDISLNYFLEAVNMQNAFHHKFGADIHRKDKYSKDTKSEFLKEFLKDKSFDKIILIDDMEQAIEMGLRFNAITFRFHRNSVKPKSKAHYVIDDLREVLNFI